MNASLLLKVFITVALLGFILTATTLWAIRFGLAGLVYTAQRTTGRLQHNRLRLPRD